jgi:CRP-like cAMP-binding protein
MDTARLRAIPLFADLPPAELDVLATVALESGAAAGETVVHEGDEGHAFFAIEDGSAKVNLIDVPLREIGPGDVFGETAFVADRRRSATVIAKTPLRLIAVQKRDVDTLEAEAPELMKRLRALIGDRRWG